MGTPAQVGSAKTGGGSSAITFGRPTTVSVGAEGFEPDLRINSQDQMFSSVPNGFATTISFMWRSLDDGQSWKLVPNSSGDGTGKLLTCVGGGDTEEVIDNQNRLYFADLQGLTNFSASRSTDNGVTFQTNCAATPTNTLVDRQWYAVDGDPYSGGHIFLAYDQVAQSTDIGCGFGNNEVVLTESPPPASVTPSADAGLVFGPQNRASCQEGIMGNDEVSPLTDPTYGQHYVFDVHDNGNFNAVYMLRCVQVPATVDPSGLTCTDHLVYQNPNMNDGANFATMAIDRAGNLYAAWAQTSVDSSGNPNGPTPIELAYSTDNGNTWSQPVQVSQGCGTSCSGTQTNTNVYPWVTAGDAGRVDIAWYGTPTLKNPGGQYGADTLTNASWNVYMAQSLAANTTKPGFTLTQVSEKPIHYGSMFVVAQGGNGDRTSGDFLNIRTGLNGEANITYVDSANDTDLGQDFFIRQNGGPSLYSSVGTVPSFAAPSGGVTVPACTSSNPDEASFDASGLTFSQCGTNLDLTGSSVRTDPNNGRNLQITLQVANLTSLAAPANSGGTVVDWLTAWHQPCTAGTSGCVTNGHLFFAYMESANGGTPTFYDGAASSVCCAWTTYPGRNALKSSSASGVCQTSTSVNCYLPGSPGKIVIDVPKSDVANPSTLYSVTSSTLTQQAAANSNNANCSGSLSSLDCGVLFNVINSTPAYDVSVTR